MKLVTVRSGGDTWAGRVEGAAVVQLPQSDVTEIISQGERGMDEARSHGGIEHDLDSLDLAPVIPRPGKIICVGLNYRSHMEEMGREPDEFPTLFASFAETLIGAKDPIMMPSVSKQLDWEAELTVVVGRSARNAGPREAAAAIAGFTVYNDISARDWQRRTTQWLQGKTFEKTSPLGPMLVTADELGDNPELEIECRLDGELVQHASTRELVFTPSMLVAYISSIITLQPGDIIATGTPNGVGAGCTPPRYLSAGQTLETTIEGIGTLANMCIEESQ